MSYVPKLNDYVRWKQSHFVDEGWVYFKCDDYITIEIGTKDKPDELVNIHKKTHILVICQSQYWNELEYVKNRRDENDMYKSQEPPTGCNRYSDP